MPTTCACGCTWPQVWHPRIVSEPGGAQRSAELVVELLGGSDATGAFMELVLGSTGTTGEDEKYTMTGVTCIVGVTLQACPAHCL
jgi:hypothetical protein